MTRANLHELVDALPEEAVAGAGLFLERVVRGEVDPEQAWVWTTEWQDQVRSSLEDLASGRTQRFETGEDFLASL
jgi:hypothetical protein